MLQNPILSKRELPAFATSNNVIYSKIYTADFAKFINAALCASLDKTKVLPTVSATIATNIPTSHKLGTGHPMNNRLKLCQLS